MADPTDLEALGVVRRRTQKRVRPAVAGPTEILRAVRLLYASPNAGTGKPEAVDSAKLAAIEIDDAAGGGDEQPFEGLNRADIQGSPLSPLPHQLRRHGPPPLPPPPRPPPPPPPLPPPPHPPPHSPPIPLPN